MISKRFTSTFTVTLVLSALGLSNFVDSASASTGNNHYHSPPININADISSSSSSSSSSSLSLSDDAASNSLDGRNDISPPPPLTTTSIPIPVPPSSPKPAEKTPSIVKLDLAGEIKTHISSPTYVGSNGIHMEAKTDMDTAPLFQWGTIRTRDGSVDEMSGGVGVGVPGSNFSRCLNMPIPTVHLGAKYNFKTAWYGATRLIGNLSWGHPLKSSTSNGNSNSSKHILTNIRGELGLQNPYDYSVEVGFAMPRNDENMNISKNNIRSTRSKLSLRYDTRSTIGTVSASTSIHRRLGLVGKATILLGDVLRPAPPKLGYNVISANDDEKRAFKLESIPKDASASFFQHKIPQEELNLMEGSWLPEVKMTAGGQARAGSSIGLKDWDLRKILRDNNNNDQASGNNSMNKVGVRLMVSRQLNWNIVGMFNGSTEDAEYDNDTTLKLEVGGLGEYGYTSVSAEAAVERIGETFRCTLLQEQIFKCTN